MSNYLIDRTADHLRAGAKYAAEKSIGDRRFEVIARDEHVWVRGSLGGSSAGWTGEGVDWDALASAKDNPLPGIIDGIEFRLERQRDRLVAPGNSGQKNGHGDGQQHISGN